MDKLTKLTRDNLWTAVDDYRRHTYETDVLDDISDNFIDRLAHDSIESKRELRELFRKSQGWDENLQAIVINGTKTHNPDYVLVNNLANKILSPARLDATAETRFLIDRSIGFFARPNDKSFDAIDAIQQLSPNAYAPHKKRSRIFKALCDSLNVTDNSAGSQFQRLFAQFADELSTRKIDFKLFLSINPAHFLTMSNPKDDKRGDTLISCHSFNDSDCQYNCGCSGYARDKYTFIVFTAADPDQPETLNNRKTTRQVFVYKPSNGLLLQSRLYKTSGGTRGSQTESKLYRDLVQRELSELEDAPNLWITEKYCGNKRDIYIPCGNGFGGYPDWPHSDFDSKISIREDHLNDFKSSRSGLTACVFVAATKFPAGFIATAATPTKTSFAKTATSITPKRGKSSTATANAFKFASTAATTTIVFANTAKNITPATKLSKRAMALSLAPVASKTTLCFATSAKNIFLLTKLFPRQTLMASWFTSAGIVAKSITKRVPSVMKLSTPN